MLKLILADNFFHENDAQRLYSVASNFNFVEKEYGEELDNFNLIFPDTEPIFSKYLGEKISIDEKRSGIFRKSMGATIHFESFDSPNEWCFIVALEDNLSFNLYRHKSGAISAMQGYQFDYKNLFDWDYDVNIELKANQGVFFRPWLFHTADRGMVQYYRLLGQTINTDIDL